MFWGMKTKYFSMDLICIVRGQLSSKYNESVHSPAVQNIKTQQIKEERRHNLCIASSTKYKNTQIKEERRGNVESY